MASSFTFRPTSSLRDQQISPYLPSINNTPYLANRPVPGAPSPRISSNAGPPSERFGTAPLSSNDPHSSPLAPSARSVEYTFDRRSVSTAATSFASHDIDHLPPSTAIDTQKPDRFSPRSNWSDRHSFPRSTAAMTSIDKSDLGARRPPSPPPALRRPTSPAGRISNHSAEWDMHSDRGSPHVAGRRPHLPMPASASASSVAAAVAPHSAYARDYASSPRASFRESAYRDPRDAHAVHRERELSPAGASSLKRKHSISSDLGARRGMADRVDRGDRNGNAYAAAPPADFPARGAYPESAYYRGRERGESPERSYAGSYSRDAAYSGRYVDPRLEDPHYSPRHAHPTSPSTSRTAYHRGHDATTPSGHPYHPSRRSDRYSPAPSPRSPSYAPRQALPPPQAPSSHDPYSRSTPHSSYSRRPSPPPFGADMRPQLPPLSSRAAPSSRYPPPPPPAAAAAAAPPQAASRGRYTPPLEASHIDRLSPTPEPHAYSEPFYPDRRLYFARERIQDPEMDDYYHGPIGSAGGKARYADHPYDPYGSPHAGSYPPKGSNGAGPMAIPSPGMGAHPGSRHHDARGPYGGGSYGHGDYMPDPRDMHPHAGMPRPLGHMGRPIMVPAAHVPPGPSAGIAPPPRRRGKLPKPVTDLLKSWLLEHASHPYPTEDEKRSLCSMTGLTLSQVSNWFINARRRILLPTGANGSPNGGSTAAQVKAAFSADSQSPEP